MIALSQLESLIQRTLRAFHVDRGTFDASVRHLLDLAAQRSGRGTYFRQGDGPGLGLFCMDPETEQRIWDDRIRFRRGLQNQLVELLGIVGPDSKNDPVPALETNLAYQILLAYQQFCFPERTTPPEEVALPVETGAGFSLTSFESLVRRVLAGLTHDESSGLDSESAVRLLLGTAAQESRFGTYLRQLGAGPALGVFQMEPRTEQDIWQKHIFRRQSLCTRIMRLSWMFGPTPYYVTIPALEVNLAYQIIMARLHYRRVPEALPEPDDLYGLGAYWKKYYNTTAGRGTATEFVDNYDRFVREGVCN